MTDTVPVKTTTQFVLLSVKHDAAYWSPATMAQAVHDLGLLEAPTEDALAAFTDAVLHALIGKAAERFWASDAVTPTRAASIRAACRSANVL